MNVSGTEKSWRDAYRAMPLLEKQRNTSHIALYTVMYEDFELMSEMMKDNDVIKHDLIEHAICLNKMEVLEWFLERGGGTLKDDGYWSNAMGTAISSSKNEDISMLIWLHEHGLPLTSYLSVVAAEHNHIAALDYLYTHATCLNKMSKWETHEFVITVALYARHHKDNGDDGLWKFLEKIGVLV